MTASERLVTELMRKDVTSDSCPEQCRQCFQKVIVYKLLCSTDRKYQGLVSSVKHYEKAPKPSTSAFVKKTPPPNNKKARKQTYVN